MEKCLNLNIGYKSFINGQRDHDGFLVLETNQIMEENIEKMGSCEKTKFWVEFLDGTKALIKVGDERKTLGYYAELIVEKLAKQVGLEHAQNDGMVKKGFSLNQLLIKMRSCIH